jgi:hypothetical protein
MKQEGFRTKIVKVLPTIHMKYELQKREFIKLFLKASNLKPEEFLEVFPEKRMKDRQLYHKLKAALIREQFKGKIDVMIRQKRIFLYKVPKVES